MLGSPPMIDTSVDIIFIGYNLILSVQSTTEVEEEETAPIARLNQVA